MINLIKKHPKYSAALSLLIIAAILFFVFSENYIETFTKNIVPELVGVAIELAIIIFVFDWIAGRQEKRKAREMEKRAREYLRFIIINLMENETVFALLVDRVPTVEKYRNNKKKFEFYAKDRKDNEEIIDALIDILKDTDDVELSSQIKEHLRHDLASFHSFAPVVAQISEKHIKIWGRIIFFITKTIELEKVNDNIINVLTRIKKFDEQTEVEFNI